MRALVLLLALRFLSAQTTSDILHRLGLMAGAVFVLDTGMPGAVVPAFATVAILAISARASS